MNLTIGFALGSILFLTPALILVAALRLNYPIHRTMSFLKEGFTLPAAALMISWIVNGPLFLDYVSWSLTHVPSLWQGIDVTAIASLVDVQQFSVFRPGTWVVRHLWRINSSTDHNVLVMIVDVHLRVLMFSVTLILTLRSLSSLSQFVETRIYSRRIARVGASQFVAESTRRFALSPLRAVDFVRDALYHPWALLTSHNPQREVLMVDLLCKNDNLYSGMFTSWTPDGKDDASAVALQYILRYYPRPAVAPEGEVSRSTNLAPPTSTEALKSARKTAFVLNNGEMVIPLSEVISVHFWEIRVGTDFIVAVSDLSQLEVAKWMLAINVVSPKKVKHLLIDIQNPALTDVLDEWIREKKLGAPNVTRVRPNTVSTP